MVHFSANQHISPLRLQVGILVHCIETRTGLCGIQIVVTDNHGAGVTPVEVLEQLSHGCLLFSRPRVGGLTSDVVAALVADAYRMGVMIHAVGANHPFRTSWLNLSVTTDHVVVAYTELPVLFLSMVSVYLCHGTRLVWLYCTAVNNNQCNLSHFQFSILNFQLQSPQLCTRIVELIAVRIVITICTIFFQVSFFIFTFLNFYILKGPQRGTF